MSKISGVARGLEGWWSGCPVQRSDKNSRRHNHMFPPSRGQLIVPIHILNFEIAGHQDRQAPPKHGVRSVPISGREGER
jgi:hypothetical protein